jgi:hypothetical protein
VSGPEVVVPTTSSSGPRGGRVRSFVGQRSAPTKLGFLGAAAVLATAPFGGLESAPEQDVARLELGQRIDVGPFDLTLEKVSQVGDLEPAISPETKGTKLLTLTVQITNHTDRAESSSLAVQAIGGDHTGGVPWEGEETIQARAFDVDDASRFDTEYVNPGQTYTLALVFQQDPETDLDRVELTVYGYYFQAVDPQTLDPDRWVLDDVPLATGRVPIRVKE